MATEYDGRGGRSVVVGTKEWIGWRRCVVAVCLTAVFDILSRNRTNNNGKMMIRDKCIAECMHESMIESLHFRKYCRHAPMQSVRSLAPLTNSCALTSILSIHVCIISLNSHTTPWRNSFNADSSSNASTTPPSYPLRNASPLTSYSSVPKPISTFPKTRSRATHICTKK